MPRLNGCVNDIEAFADFLQARVNGAENIAIELKILKNTAATRDAKLWWTPLSRPKNGDPSLLSGQAIVALSPR